jgi:hypothetical protein
MRILLRNESLIERRYRNSYGIKAFRRAVAPAIYKPPAHGSFLFMTSEAACASSYWEKRSAHIDFQRDSFPVFVK